MIIKKFQGKTENEAIESAKKELGEGIVVMNVKEVKPKGLFAFLRQKMIEVTVALEIEQPSSYSGKKTVSVQKAETERTEKTEKVSDKLETNAIEEKLDSLQSLLVKQLQKPEKEDMPQGDSDIEKEEEEPDELMVFMKLLHDTMMDNEVDETYIDQIMEKMEKEQNSKMPFDYVLANIYQKMILKFGNPIGVTPAKKGPKVLFFIGPTGVGKTTTIAKIASQFKVDQKKKIALLTADTYRIAATEQLRTYANILEVPFRVIYNAEEITNAIEDFGEFDYIFVDTTGHSHHNAEQKDGMKQLLNVAEGIAEKEIFLVLSATTKYRDLLYIADAYSFIPEYKLIFTKLDETEALGNLLNVKLYTGAELAYVTYGQNVPDDIEHFDPQKTVKKLLGGKK